MRRLSKVTGDQSRDVATIPSSHSERNSMAIQPQRESVTSRSLAGNLGSGQGAEIRAAILTPAIQQ